MHLTREPPAEAGDPVICPTCEAEISGRFCARCGERRPAPDALAFRHLAADLVAQVNTLDSKLARSLALVARKPGQLLVEYRRGARARYSSPTQLFLLTSVAFFVLVPALSIFDYRMGTSVDVARLGHGWEAEALRARVRAAGSPEAFRVAFDATVNTHMQALFGLVVPVFAVALAGALPRRRLAEHVVAAVHLAPAYMIALTSPFVALRALGAAARVLPLPDANRMLVGLAVAALLGFTAHAAAAVRRGFGVGWGHAAGAAALLAAAAAAFPQLYFRVVTTATMLLLPR